MDNALRAHVQSIAKQLFGNQTTLHTCSRLGGGCISEVWLCTLVGAADDPSKRQIVVKVNSADFWDAFEAERQGLSDLARVGVIRVPACLDTAICDQRAVLICEAIQTRSPPKTFDACFGKALARHHRQSMEIAPNRYGYSRDNYLGRSLQPNAWCDRWCEFFVTHRLQFQLDWARQQNAGSRSLYDRVSRVIERAADLLDGSDPSPVMLHGDLWQGNILCDADGQPVIIDPAVYYGSREAELGMIVWLGACSDAFYEAYHQEWPLADRWQQRVRLYTLYHQLNHVNLFGGGYESECIRTADCVLASS